MSQEPLADFCSATVIVEPDSVTLLSVTPQQPGAGASSP